MIPRTSKQFHYYLSANNPGATALFEELSRQVLVMEPLTYTSDPSMINECDRVLLYLNGLTWNSDEKSVRLESEMMKVLRAGKFLVAVHEAEAFELAEEHDASRFGVKCSTFFDSTPKGLVASGLYGGRWSRTPIV